MEPVVHLCGFKTYSEDLFVIFWAKHRMYRFHIQTTNMEPMIWYMSTVQGSCLDAKISLSVSIRGLMAPETSPRKADR
jgi:hypothetical protein